MSNHRTGIVVPHTHWDRAWYLPFQAYRLRLVEMMSGLLDLLESGGLPNFVLDGQTVVLEDHLAIRPHDRPRITALVESGRLALGPWYTMPDCFLARPESLIRNLQRGLAMASAHGGASRVGYVPDSFGHCAQLPQILAGFGVDSFLFMRGMPEDLRDRHGDVFAWRAPEGSEVLATFLREGYFPLGALGQESFHGRYDGLPASPDRARERVGQALARILPFHTHQVVVLPAGGDHLPARGDLAPLIDQLNATLTDIQLRCGGFEDYVKELRASAARAKPPVYCGDLLGQADHPLLRNVLSSRVDLKILNHRAQSLLTRVAEPLAAWAGVNGLPGIEPGLLQAAWDALLKNQAHDDICGCSVDDVHLDDVQRFHEVLALGGGDRQPADRMSRAASPAGGGRPADDPRVRLQSAPVARRGVRDRGHSPARRRRRILRPVAGPSASRGRRRRRGPSRPGPLDVVQGASQSVSGDDLGSGLRGTGHVQPAAAGLRGVHLPGSGRARPIRPERTP